MRRAQHAPGCGTGPGKQAEKTAGRERLGWGLPRTEALGRQATCHRRGPVFEPRVACPEALVQCRNRSRTVAQTMVEPVDQEKDTPCETIQRRRGSVHGPTAPRMAGPRLRTAAP